MSRNRDRGDGGGRRVSSWGVESTLTASAALTGRIGQRGGGVDHFSAAGDADEGKSSSSSSSSSSSAPSDDKFFGAGSEDEIISLIPDLDDAAIQAADIRKQVAEAPRAAMRRVLDSECAPPNHPAPPPPPPPPPPPLTSPHLAPPRPIPTRPALHSQRT